jgi:hypothetical protein
MLELWAEEECPIADGIYFGNGEVILVPQIGTMTLHPIVRTNISSIMEYCYNWKTTLISLFRIDDESLKIHIQCGEGSDGSEGFVSVESLSDGKLIWLAYFQSSNPFEHACVEADTIIATTNRKQVWSFPIKNPELVKASPIPPGW